MEKERLNMAGFAASPPWINQYPSHSRLPILGSFL